MCTSCGTDNCNCPCEECGCQGIKINSDCVEWGGEQLGTIVVNEGDSLTTIINNIETIINEIIQNFETIVLGITEIERAPGTPTSNPTGTSPIVYVDESNGDLYTWNGTAWILNVAGITGVTLNAAAGSIVTGATAAPSLVITPSGVNTVFNIQPKFTNGAYVSPTLTPGVTIPASSVNVAVITNPLVRLRWDGEVEFDGRVVLSPAQFLTTICYGTPISILLTTLIAAYRPTVGSCPSLVKSFPVNFWMIDSTIGVTGGMEGCEVDGRYSYFYKGQANIGTNGQVYLVLNDKQFAEDVANGAVFNDAVVELGHIKYYVN